MKILKKKDWVTTVKEDIFHFGLETTIEDIEMMPKQTYKKVKRQKTQVNAFKYLIAKRNNRNGKGMALSYKGLEIQN